MLFPRLSGALWGSCWSSLEGFATPLEDDTSGRDGADALGFVLQVAPEAHGARLGQEATLPAGEPPETVSYCATAVAQGTKMAVDMRAEERSRDGLIVYLYHDQYRRCKFCLVSETREALW